MSSPESRLSTAFTELALALFTDVSLTADLERLAELACELIPACSGASVTMLDGAPSTPRP